MTREQILELAQKYGTSETALRPTFYLHDGSPTGETYPQIDWKFGQEDLLAFAQAIIEAERESSDEPAAWAVFDGEGGWDFRCYKMNENFKEEFLKRNPDPMYREWVHPLYRHPPPKQKLTDEEIIECSQKASRLFLKQQASARGMQLTVQDSFDWHFAKAIERRINGEEE